MKFQKGRNAAYYKKTKNGEDVDRALLSIIPEAARVSSQGFPPHFSWDFLPAKFYANSVPIKASQSVFNLSSNNENSMKTSNSAFEIISRAESNEELSVINQPIDEEPMKPISARGNHNGMDLNNNSANSLRSSDMNDEYEIEKEPDTETLVSEQKFNGQPHHHNQAEYNETDNVSNSIHFRSVCVVSLYVFFSSSIKLLFS